MKKRNLQIKHLIFKVITVILIQNTSAQTSLKGKIEDGNENPLPFANILLLQSKDSSLVSGIISNEMGVFLMENITTGNYLLNVRMMGYEGTYIDSIIISQNQKELALGTIRLTESAMELEGVEVQGQKPLFEKQADRTVVNVQNSITNAGSTVLQVLEKSPGVMVNRANNSIAMNGKNGVLVMINGKESHLPMDATVQMLNGLSAANIEKIELITSPPAKYDAAGNAGIINIKMAKDPNLGTNGNLGAIVGYNYGSTLAGNFNLSHLSQHWNTYVNYSINRDRTENQWNVGNEYTKNGFTQSDISKSHRTPTTTVQNLQIGAEYDLGDRTTASLLITGYRRNWDMDATTDDMNRQAPDTTYLTHMDLHETNIWQSATTSLGFAHQLNEQQKLDITLDYLYYHNNNPSQYDIQRSLQGSDDLGHEIVRTQKRTPIQFEVGKIDYTNQLNEHLTLDFGLKESLSSFDNNVEVSRSEGENMVIDPEFTNSADLKENIFAAYGSYNWQLGEHLTISGGLRYEYTDTYLSTPEEAGLVDRTYGHFFPNVTFTRELGGERKLVLAYNRRIARPTFNDMAPFVFFAGPNTFIAGNLSLKPSITDGAELSYQQDQWWVSLNYSFIQDAIAFLQPDYNLDTGQLVYRSQNMDYKQQLGLSLALPITLAHWWKLQSDVSLYGYIIKVGYLQEPVELTTVNLAFNITNSFTLPANFSIELSADYQTSPEWGIFKMKSLGQVNLGIRKKLGNDAVISLVGTDLLHNYIWNSESKIHHPDEHWELNRMYYDWGLRGISLTYTQPFGNKKLKAVEIKQGAETERKRVQ